MASPLQKLWAVIALFMIPMAMGSVGAPATWGHHHATAASHCDEKLDKLGAPARQEFGCTAACTALTAASMPVVAATLNSNSLPLFSDASAVAGIEPEVVTPPPRQT